MVETIIRGTIIQSASKVIENGAVYIENDMITEVDTWDNIRHDYSGQVYGSKDHIVHPGFVNTHSHAVQTLFRGAADDKELLPWLNEVILPGEATLKAGEFEASCRIGYAEMLLSGITTTNDMLSANHSEVGLEAASLSGIRARVGKMLMDRNVPDGLNGDTTEILEEAAQLSVQYPSGGRIQYSYCPRFIPTCSDELMQRSSQDAKDQGLMMHTHASENQSECVWVQELTGYSNIEALHKFNALGDHVILAHGIWTSREERLLIKESNTSISHNPTSNAKLGSGIAPVPEYLEQGTRVGLATDGSPATGGHDFYLEMKLAGFLQKASKFNSKLLPARSVFNMATYGGAKSLNFQNVGLIEPGYKADIVMLNTSNPNSFPLYDPFSFLVYTAQTRDIEGVWVDGIAKVLNGELLDNMQGFFDIAKKYAKDKPFLSRS